MNCPSSARVPNAPIIAASTGTRFYNGARFTDFCKFPIFAIHFVFAQDPYKLWKRVLMEMFIPS